MKFLFTIFIYFQLSINDIEKWLGVNDLKLFSLLLSKRLNKLACLNMETLFGIA